MMKTAATSILSVLLLRSSCTPPRTTSTNVETQQFAERLLLSTHPLVCDIAILPELPVDTNEEFHVQTSAFLNPCGENNVVLLSELPPSMDNRSFLLSLTSCNIDLDNKNNHSGMSDTHLLPVHAVPSTFAFSLQEEDAAIVGGSHHGTSAVLDVAFDYDPAAIMSHFKERAKPTTEFLLQQQQEDLKKQHVDGVDAKPVTTSILQGPSSRNDNVCTTHEKALVGSSDRYERTLHRLRETLQEEASNLDLLLCFLGVVLFLLFVAFGITATPLVWNPQKQPKTKQENDGSKCLYFVQSVWYHGKRIVCNGFAHAIQVCRLERFKVEERRKRNVGSETEKAAAPPVASVAWKTWTPYRSATRGTTPPPSREFTTSSSSPLSEPSSLSGDSIVHRDDDKMSPVTAQVILVHDAPSLAIDHHDWVLGKSGSRRSKRSHYYSLGTKCPSLDNINTSITLLAEKESVSHHSSVVVDLDNSFI